MLHPDDIAGLPTQPHHGVAARLARRFGGLARTAIAVLTRRRRPAASPATPTSPAAATRNQPTPPKRPRTQRSTNAPPPRPGWIASWFGRRPPLPAWSQAAFSSDDDTAFTPERYPELTPGACALLNTPAEDLDPRVRQALLAALAALIAEAQGLGATDLEALFATLWQRLAAPLGHLTPDEAPAGPPDEAPQPASQAAPNQPPKPRPPAAPRNTACSGAAAANVTPTPLTPPPPANRSRPLRRGHRRHRRIALARAAGGRQQKPPPRHLRHAAATGPP